MYENKEYVTKNEMYDILMDTQSWTPRIDIMTQNHGLKLKWGFFKHKV